MVRKFETETFKVICDPHLGRRFKTGVPLERRGEIETSFWNAFLDEVTNSDKPLIIAGDLFDTPFADLDTIMRCWNILSLCSTDWYILAGNHDLPKDVERTCALDILRELSKDSQGVIITDFAYFKEDRVVLVPWGQESTLKDFDLREIKYIIGHFEKDALDGVAIPETCRILSGHYHLPQKCGRIEYIGSLLPITFGEYDPIHDYDIMRTMSLAQYLDAGDKLKNCRVRLRLRADETPPTEVASRQLVWEYEDESENGGEIQSTDSLDLKQIFDRCLADCPRKDLLWLRYRELRNRC